MRRDIAIAGVVLTADDWDALDEASRAELRPLVDAVVEAELYEVSSETSLDHAGTRSARRG